MLQGPDVDVEISLKEYGIAWEVGEDETRFYHGTGHNGTEYIHFDWADVANDVDVGIEFDWADFKEVRAYTGMSKEEWDGVPLVYKIQDLVDYYGAANIFGESYTEPMTYDEVIALNLNGGTENGKD